MDNKTLRRRPASRRNAPPEYVQDRSRSRSLRSKAKKMEHAGHKAVVKKTA